MEPPSPRLEISSASVREPVFIVDVDVRASASDWGRMRDAHPAETRSLLDRRPGGDCAVRRRRHRWSAAPAAGAARAAEVGAGGALELTIAGFARHARASAASSPSSARTPSCGRARLLQRHRGPRPGQGARRGAGPRLRRHDRVRGRHRREVNTDETWLFLRGGWGELRLGDVDGRSTPAPSAPSRSPPAPAASTATSSTRSPSTRSRRSPARRRPRSATTRPASPACRSASAIRPRRSTTRQTRWPPPTRRSSTGSRRPLVYEAEFERFDLAASRSRAASGELKDHGAARRTAVDRPMPGASLELSELELGAGLGAEDAGGQRRRYANVGVGRWLGAGLHLAHPRPRAGHGGYDGVGAPWNLVLSADLELAARPGCWLATSPTSTTTGRGRPGGPGGDAAGSGWPGSRSSRSDRRAARPCRRALASFLRDF